MNTLLEKTSNQELFSHCQRPALDSRSVLDVAVFVVDYSTTVRRETDYLHLSAALKMTTSGVEIRSTVSQILPSTLPGRSTQQAVNELRKLSGLTWDQLATLFNVSRRSIHFWASGQPLASANEEKLNRVLDVVEYISLGSASRNRSLLMDIADDGKSYLEMLAAGEYNQLKSILNAGNAPKKPKSGQLSKAAELSRMPPNPADLVDALQDSIHSEVGKSRVAKSVRSRNR
jgi:DNA-binding transcriptional regulator YiaG